LSFYWYRLTKTTGVYTCVVINAFLEMKNGEVTDYDTFMQKHR